jgi:four helix bundle protein
LLLPYERLEVYWLAEEYVAFIDHVLRRLKRSPDVNQLTRAAGSITFNIAEGASDRPRGDRIRMFTYARRSVGEANSIFKRLARTANVSEAEVRISYFYADRISGMLWKLIHAQ